MAKSPLNVQLLRSSVAGRRPQVADMEYGALAVNYNHNDPALIIKGDDNTLIEFKPASNGVTSSAVPPATPAVGDLWFSTVKGQLYCWYDDGTSRQWVSISRTGPSGITTLTATAPLSATGTGASRALAIADATAAAKGVVQLASSAEAAAGTDALKVVTPKALHDGYLVKDISTLPALP